MFTDEQTYREIESSKQQASSSYDVEASSKMQFLQTKIEYNKQRFIKRRAVNNGAVENVSQCRLQFNLSKSGIIWAGWTSQQKIFEP